MQYQSFSCDASFTHCWCNWQFNLGVFNHVRPRALSHSATHITLQFLPMEIYQLWRMTFRRARFFGARAEMMWGERVTLSLKMCLRVIYADYFCIWCIHVQCCAFILIRKRSLLFFVVLAGDLLPPALFLSLYNMHACVVERVRRAVPGYRKHKRCLKCHMRGTNNVRPFINREKPTSWALWGPRHFVRSLHQARHQMVLVRQNSRKFWIWVRPWSTMHLALRHSAF